MPGKGTQVHSIRIPAALWDAARAKAGKQGKDVSAVIRGLLEQWVTQGEGDER